jgi:O-antigen/teichoic acid export membrane protein
MALWALISGCMSVESCLLAALNRTREQGVLSIIAAVVNLAVSIVLVQHIGSPGVIGGTILSYLFVLVVPQSMIVRGLLKRELAAKEETELAFCASLFPKTKNGGRQQLVRDSLAKSG